MRKFFRLLVSFMLWSCAGVLLVLSLAAAVPQPDFYVDNIAQLRLPIMIAAVIFLPIALLFRRKYVASLTAAILVVAATPALSLCLPDSATARAAGGERIKVIAANVWGARNLDTTRFEELVRKERPEVFILIEMTPAWIKALREHLPEYTTEFDEGLSGGTAIFSRIPIQQINMNAVHPRHRRFGVRGIITIGKKQILLIGSHPPAPSAIPRWYYRNTELERLATDVRAEQGRRPVVIAGDLNTTPWSWYFRNLITSGSLHDSEQGLGPQPSWSTRMPLCLVPIDHALYTDGIAITSRRLGPNIGSDHLPLVFEVTAQ